jgi:hypothetical protein
MVASAVSRASQAEPRAARVASQVSRATLVVVQALVQAQAQVDLRALLLARGFLISVHLPGDQPVVTLMPLLRPRLLPKLLVLWVPALKVRVTPVPDLVARLLASSATVSKQAKVRLLDLELELALELEPAPALQEMLELELALQATLE